MAIPEALVAAAAGALCAFFLWLWPAGAPTAVAMMKAPGASGALISRAAFLANPKLYFHLLRHIILRRGLYIRWPPPRTIVARCRTRKEKDNNSTSGVEAMVLLALGAVASYFLWPVAGVVMMKAPGAAGFLISRAAFLGNPKLYFTLLRTAAFAVAP
ncbi:hypothetical protein PR202_gb21573 [Eleusine coracana subsp. coracana]|uniref:Uncharacterized protein n=1 Tax=Eleusine coracana subsp. coracana TaxID=191504 RepID=A0AAV5FDG1_ELECO|nr:hypothetical protein PR202_gb21573 [Eleusine coracana subsp. coracana]